jgi:putative Holliday junction resolvase
MRILGIDYGDSKIGIALSDPFGWTAQGLETIKYTDINAALKRIQEIITANNVDKIVIGFPKNMNGSVGPRGEKTIEFIELLKKFFDKEIIKWDERLTTVAAENLLISSNMRREKRKNVIDTVAATYILQGYLNFISNK